MLWLGLRAGHPLLHQLRQRLHDTLLAAGLDADLRTFHPHITVARCVATPAAADTAAHWLPLHHAFAGSLFRVDAFALCTSELHPAGAVHRTLTSFPLTKQGPRTSVSP